MGICADMGAGAGAVHRRMAGDAEDQARPGATRRQRQQQQQQNKKAHLPSRASHGTAPWRC